MFCSDDEKFQMDDVDWLDVFLGIHVARKTSKYFRIAVKLL